MRIKKILLSLSLVAIGSAHTFAPTTFLQPYDPALRLPAAPEKYSFRFGANTEWGQTKNGYNWDSNRANVLRLYNDSQSTLAMIEQPISTVNTAALQAVRNAHFPVVISSPRSCCYGVRVSTRDSGTTHSVQLALTMGEASCLG